MVCIMNASELENSMDIKQLVLNSTQHIKAYFFNVVRSNLAPFNNEPKSTHRHESTKIRKM